MFSCTPVPVSTPLGSNRSLVAECARRYDFIGKSRRKVRAHWAAGFAARNPLAGGTGLCRRPLASCYCKPVKIPAVHAPIDMVQTGKRMTFFPNTY